MRALAWLQHQTFVHAGLQPPHPVQRHSAPHPSLSLPQDDRRASVAKMVNITEKIKEWDSAPPSFQSGHALTESPRQDRGGDAEDAE